MRALVELVDEFGEAIESDLSSVHGDALRDYLLGFRPAGEALRKVRMLPPGSVTVAHMQAWQEAGGPPSDPDRWRAFVGVTPGVHAAWDVYDAVVAHAQAGSKRAPLTHPRTRKPVKARGRQNAARALG